MSQPTIKVLDNGPLLINGEIDLVDGAGNKVETTQETYLCRCGLSANQPFCSGAHEGKFNNAVRTK